MLKKIMNEIVTKARKDKITFCIYMIVRLFIVFTIVTSFIRKEYENIFVCVLSLVLLMIPGFISDKFSIELPSVLEVIIILFIFCSEILGEINCYYIKFQYWDTMLHTINGFICAAIGFSLVEVLNRKKKDKFNLSPLFLSMVAFCFSMTIGILWEFFEFGCDYTLHTDMQKDTIVHSISSVTLDETNKNVPVHIDNIKEVTVNGEKLNIDGYLDIGLYDTMKDLFVNFIGALVFSVIGYFYVKKRGKGNFAKQFIPKVKKDRICQPSRLKSRTRR